MQIIHLTPEGFKTHGNAVMGYVKDGILYLNSPALNVMIENESDIDELKDALPPGTRFFLAGSHETWQLGANGTPSKSEIPGTFYLDPETMNLYYTSEVE